MQEEAWGQNENTYILDAESAIEMARLIDQDRMTTEAMGGLFPSAIDLMAVKDVLDAACGPGGWARDVAMTYPDMQVKGIDNSARMIQYASAYIKVQGLENISFDQLNVVKPLPYADASFDLVNARLMVGFLHRESWPLVVREFVRVTRPGGYVVLTECDEPAHTNAPSLEEYTQLTLQASSRVGQSQHPRGLHWGAVPMLGHHLRQAGCKDIAGQAHLLDCSAGTDNLQRMIDNYRMGLKLIQPFLIKQGLANQQYLDDLYERVMAEMTSEDFRGVGFLATFWGVKV